MPRDSQVAISLVRAIENGHIPLQENSEGTLERILLSNDPTARKAEQRKALELISTEIDHVIQQLDGEINAIAEDSLGDDLDSIRDIVKNLAAEMESVRSMQGKIEIDDSLASTGLSQFAEIYDQYEASTSQNSEIDATKSLLAQIREWSQIVADTESAIEDSRLDLARKSLVAARNLLLSLEKHTRMIAILPKLVAKNEALVTSVKGAFAAQWDRIIHFQYHEDGATLTVTTDAKGNLAYSKYLMEGLDDTISNLRALDILEPKILDLTQRLTEKFIRPLVKCNHSISSNSVLLIKRENSSHPPEATFKYLTLLVTHVSTIFPEPILDALTTSLFPLLIAEILTNFLPFHIPVTIADLPTFDVLLDAVSHFDMLLVNLGWASETPLIRWVSDAPRIWFANRQAAFLSDTRLLVIHESTSQRNIVISSGIDILSDPQTLNSEVVKETIQDKTKSEGTTEKPDEDDDDDEADGWGFDTADEETEEEPDVVQDQEPDSWNWDDENDDVNPPNEDSNSFPYAISPIPECLMEIVQRLLNEGTQLVSTEYSIHAALEHAGDYSVMIASIFAAWRAIIQLRKLDMTHGELMRLSNDALYLSHRLIPHSGDPHISGEMQRLSSWGHAWFSQELSRTGASLSTILATADGFVNSAHPEQSRKCSNAIKSVKEELLVICKQYQVILPPQQRRLAVGELLSSVLQHLNTSLTLMEDISADESTFLIGLYTSLFTMESLFDPLGAGQFCAEWLRSQYIRELLEWRMVDIMDSWREGLLQGVFERDEMVGWLKKLFQDSDVRARNIVEIQRG